MALCEQTLRNRRIVLHLETKTSSRALCQQLGMRQRRRTSRSYTSRPLCPRHCITFLSTSNANGNLLCIYRSRREACKNGVARTRQKHSGTKNHPSRQQFLRVVCALDVLGGRARRFSALAFWSHLSSTCYPSRPPVSHFRNRDCLNTQ